MSRFFLLFGLLVGVTLQGQAQNRFEGLTKKFAATPDNAKVISAGYLGGSGTEYLVGGGFQKDGVVVLVGVTLGPKLDIGGVKETVLGKDAPAPAEWKAREVISNGKVQTNKDGTPRLRPAGWDEENATAFIVRLDEDFKKVLTVSRFPWKSAGVTSAVVDSDGFIYLAGPCSAGVTGLGNDVKEEKVEDNGAKGLPKDHSYLAKLDPKAEKVIWVRHFKGLTAAPDLILDKARDLKFTGPDIRTYSKDGKLKNTLSVPGGISGRTAVNPKDGTYARGGQTLNWNTGREPYRDPKLDIFNPDGKQKLELYHWPGPLVGLDNLRLVSDSEVRALRYDDEGNLVIYAWSDGGNSVMYREPFDVRTMAKEFKGLGMSAYAANVLSCAYIIKIDTKTYKVSGGTLWLAYRKDQDKPNSIWVDTLGFAGDGSILMAGKSAWGLIQTGNALATEPTGNYISVLSQDCTSLRFSSAMPACGKAEVNNSSTWGVIKGTWKGKPVAMYVSGAIEKEKSGEQELAAPSVGRDTKFGGGGLDGYFLLLDLSKK